ncbi:MAG: hypothetical protein HYX79_07000 [Chloroflexi bacterium]|nr:hypothetical protein [Chloroflexota bacterium]
MGASSIPAAFFGSLLAVLGLSLTTGTTALSPYSEAAVLDSDSKPDNLIYKRRPEKRRDIMVVRERATKGLG